MLNIKISTAGNSLRIRRVASMPLNSGSAQSITITCGRNSSASRTASGPSLASATTEISGSSSNMRRKPRRTRAWSSTSRTVILRGMSLQFVLRDFHTNQCSSLSGVRDLQSASDQFGTLAHAHQTDASRSISIWHVRAGGESFAVIFHFQLKGIRQKFKANPCLRNNSVAANVVKRFLNDAKNMYTGAGVYGKWLAGFFIVQTNPRLALHRRNIPVQGGLESRFFK